MQHHLLGVSHLYVLASKLPDETAHRMGLYGVDARLCVCLSQVKFVPFNPTDKYTIATIQDASGGPVYRLMKGAPQVQLLWVSCGYFVKASGKAALEYVHSLSTCLLWLHNRFSRTGCLVHACRRGAEIWLVWRAQMQTLCPINRQQPTYKHLAACPRAGGPQELQERQPCGGGGEDHRVCRPRLPRPGPRPRARRGWCVLSDSKPCYLFYMLMCLRPWVQIEALGPDFESDESK